MRLIDADALIAEMKEYRTEQEKEQMYSGDRGNCVTWNDAVFFIKNAPTIEPERKRGKWFHDVAFYDEEGCPCVVSRCNQCGEENPETNYCPNCGADMRSEQKEDT